MVWICKWPCCLSAYVLIVCVLFVAHEQAVNVAPFFHKYASCFHTCRVQLSTFFAFFKMVLMVVHSVQGILLLQETNVTMYFLCFFLVFSKSSAV